MFLQLFRNKIWENYKLRNKIRSINQAISNNYSRREPDIIAEIANVWNIYKIIRLTPFNINNVVYNLWMEFEHKVTHGKLVTVEIKLNDGWLKNIKYETEFGDLALVVEYYLEKTLLSRRVSLLQTKKETRRDEAEITLHQLFLMQYWPNIRLNNTFIKFNNTYPEDFSFYHFILAASKLKSCSSTVCSSMLVCEKIGADKSKLIKKLKNWRLQYKTSGLKPKPPTCKITGLSPGSIATLNISRNNWSMVPKPFGKFLMDAAYLFVGTSNEEIWKLVWLVPNINVLILKVRASREPPPEEE